MLKRTGFYVEQRNRYQYISCTITIYHDHQKFKKNKTNLFHATELRLHAFINMVFLHLLRHSEMTGFGSKFRKIGNTGQ